MEIEAKTLPKPIFDHGANIPTFGIVQHREFGPLGWYYGCVSSRIGTMWVDEETLARACRRNGTTNG